MRAIAHSEVCGHRFFAAVPTRRSQAVRLTLATFRTRSVKPTFVRSITAYLTEAFAKPLPVNEAIPKAQLPQPARETWRIRRRVARPWQEHFPRNWPFFSPSREAIFSDSGRFRSPICQIRNESFLVFTRAPVPLLVPNIQCHQAFPRLGTVLA
jgi:hypothetical protein